MTSLVSGGVKRRLAQFIISIGSGAVLVGVSAFMLWALPGHQDGGLVAMVGPVFGWPPR